MILNKKLLPIFTIVSITLLSGQSSALELSDPPPKKSISVQAQQITPEQLEKINKEVNKKIKCLPIDNENDLEDKYQQLRNAKWDLSSMGCGVQYGAELAESGFFNFLEIEQQLTILGDLTEYFSVIHKSYPTLYVPPEIKAELDMRWDKNRAAGMAIISRLEPYWWWLTEFKLLSHAFILSATQHLTEHKDVIKQSQSSLSELNEILEKKPEALDALTPLIVGQTLLTLPEFTGGDPIRAIEVLKQGIELSPQNLNLYRWLIEAYVAERESELAISALKKAALVSASHQHPQDHSDTLKELVGFALSLEQKDLAGYLKYQRKLILEQNPALQHRQEAASLGHGGENPITGKHSDEL